MFCEKCGKEIPDDVKFCRYCGSSTEGNVSEIENENKSSDNSISSTVNPKEVHKKKRKVIVIAVIAIAVLVIGSAACLGYRYMMGGEATQERAIAKSIEAIADGDFDAWEKAANKDLMKWECAENKGLRNEFKSCLSDGKWVTDKLLGNVKTIDDVYIRDKDAYFDEDLDYINNDELKGSNLQMEKLNDCNEVYITYTDIYGNQSSSEYEYYYGEYDEYEYYCQIQTYKIKGRWYAMVWWL